MVTAASPNIGRRTHRGGRRVQTVSHCSRAIMYIMGRRWAGWCSTRCGPPQTRAVVEFHAFRHGVGKDAGVETEADAIAAHVAAPFAPGVGEGDVVVALSGTPPLANALGHADEDVGLEPVHGLGEFAGDVVAEGADVLAGMGLGEFARDGVDEFVVAVGEPLVLVVVGAGVESAARVAAAEMVDVVHGEGESVVLGMGVEKFAGGLDGVRITRLLARAPVPVVLGRDPAFPVDKG